jgi:hypothetical protein
MLLSRETRSTIRSPFGKSWNISLNNILSECRPDPLNIISPVKSRKPRLYRNDEQRIRNYYRTIETLDRQKDLTPELSIYPILLIAQRPAGALPLSKPIHILHKITLRPASQETVQAHSRFSPSITCKHTRFFTCGSTNIKARYDQISDTHGPDPQHAIR